MLWLLILVHNNPFFFQQLTKIKIHSSSFFLFTKISNEKITMRLMGQCILWTGKYAMLVTALCEHLTFNIAILKFWYYLWHETHISDTVNCSSLCVEHPLHCVVRMYITILLFHLWSQQSVLSKLGQVVKTCDWYNRGNKFWIWDGMSFTTIIILVLLF
jgi:hypothetical protein